MRIKSIVIFAFTVALLTSCGGSKESKIVEQQAEPTDSIVEEVVEEPSFLVKSIEINHDVAGDNKVTFEYDELDRLIKVTSHRNIGTDSEWTIESTVTYGDGVITCEAGMRKLELTLDGEGYVKKSEYFLEDEGLVQRYKYKSGKLSECIDEMDCGNSYLWDGGNVNIVKVFSPAFSPWCGIGCPEGNGFQVYAYGK